MKSRIILTFLLFSVIWGGLISRGFYLQVWPDQRLKDLQKRQFETAVTVQSRRGAILDRNGKELAATIAANSLFVDPFLVEDAEDLAQRLAYELNLPYREVLSKLKISGRRFIWLARQIEPEVEKEIRSWGVRALGFIEEPKRVYPNESLLSQALGFVGAEDRGLEGLELQYDSYLKGQGKQVILPRDARGRPLLPGAASLTDVPDGANVVLTIDSELQYFLESELHRVVKEQDADRAMGVILDAETSQILAMATNPTFDSNRAGRASAALRRNRIVTDAFEPGSTLKTFVIAGALAKGLVRPSTKYDCEGGRMRIGNRWIREADRDHDFGMLTVAEILALSSNVGMAKLAFDLGDKKVKDILEGFGFGGRLGVDLPGEVAGIMNPLPWRPHLLSNVSFGHGIAVTPLQIAAAYAAIANGGVLKKPSIVQSIVNSQGKEIQRFQPEEIRRVMTPEDAATMTLMLTSATSTQGTGHRARIPGFPVAGKTGTAQKVDLERGGYMHRAYISSFAGFVPAQAPRFVIYMAVDHPRKDFYGSQVAAPAFARVAQFAVRRAGLVPILISQKNVMSSEVPPEPESVRSQAVRQIRQLLEGEKKDQVPHLQGLTLRQALQRIHGTNWDIKIQGSGVVVRTVPAGGTIFGHNKSKEKTKAKADEQELQTLKVYLE